MVKKNCKNPDCYKGLFLAKRRDQLFCSVACRNQFNNFEYKLRMEPYKKIADQLYQQDLILAKLLRNQKSVFLDINGFKSYGIELKNARQLVYEQGKLMKAIFVSFVINNFKDNHYKLERL
ncbi:hypothetical protein [Lacibacter sediminis]|uniref:DUF2116 family Zn-ribbon domain-containing protein n=1 Tax=Lacibacter sediminis TaxID=2760713 RepID=A0A7G5XFN0_9BACT|nr:hypothetical protein [Lacibacter sediminis]QNA44283.1 hypothetical protein H4075_19805 [Lacibacter sediminis]